MSKSKTVLVVEDEASLREAIVLKLSKQGLCVLEAGTGEAAIDILKSATPDLVWLDLLLPGMNGAEVLKFIRATPRIEDTKVVVVSVSIDGAHAKLVEEGKPLACITKSNFSIDEITHKVMQYA